MPENAETIIQINTQSVTKLKMVSTFSDGVWLL